MKQDYANGKDRARQLAKDWQRDFGNTSHSWGDLAEAADLWDALAEGTGTPNS